MVRDYKKRAPKRYHSKQKEGVAGWKWLLAAVLVFGFGSFLYFLKDGSKAPETGETHLALPDPAKLKAEKSIKLEKPKAKPKQGSKAESKPKFDFYTILPEKEVVVPEHEIKTRVREEHVGKAKTKRYMMQAGSFRDRKEADSLKAQLALMGIESKIEKAVVGDTTWNRVKIGPISQMASVNSIRSRLRANHIDVVVMEIN